MFGLIPLLGLPLLFAVVLKAVFGSTVTLKEFSVQVGIVSSILVLSFFLGRWGALQDTEVWNGHIVEKTSGTQKCCHCYQKCETCERSVSNGNGGTRTQTYRCNCREVCPHVRGHWWSLVVSTGDTVPVDSCEPWGSNVPDAWAAAYVGEPAAVEHTHTNYLLADPESVFDHRDSDADYSDVPSPPEVYDLYRIDSAINRGTNLPLNEYNPRLMVLNDTLGAAKEVHIVVIATDDSDPAWAEHVEEGWLHGKKNQVVFVLGAPNGTDIEWARAFSFSRIPNIKTAVLHGMTGMQVTDTATVLGFIETTVETNFHRTPMSEYEYLASAAKPPRWLMILLYVVGILGTGGLSYVFHVKDVFGDERYRGYGNYNKRRPRKGWRSV